MRVLLDTGPLLALFNPTDNWHRRVRDWLAAHPDVELLTTWPVLTEACALLVHRARRGNQAALDCLAWVERGGVMLDLPQAASLGAIRAACERYADLPLDLADASIAEAAQRLGIRELLSIDGDFDIYRDANGRRLKNLLVR